ncbi:MAG: GWxTD domain-containing protein [Candidatus Neomarinimicrobiota bacterium]|nr:GWxTD domain-containing protein [Candidatus Neomarinimicrobiota bacterium]
MKRLTFLSIVTLFLISDSLLAQMRGRKMKELGTPQFSVSAPGYPTASPDSARLEVYVRISYDAVQFIKKGDQFVAEYEVAITILDGDEKQVKRHISSFESTAQDFNTTVSSQEGDLSAQVFVLTPDEYTCIVEVTDEDTRKTGRRKIKVDLSQMAEDAAISDLLLFDPNVKDDAYPLGLPLIPPRTVENDSTIYFYYEARLPAGTDYLFVRLLSADDNVLEEDSVDVRGKGTFLKETVQQLIVGTVSSRFKLEISLDDDFDNKNRVHSSTVVRNLWRGMTVFVDNIDKAVEQLRYIAYSDEMKKLSRSKEDKKEENFRAFWNKRDPTPETLKNELMDEYYRRIQYANDKFGTWQEGWKTAMGMIFLLFGPPDDIEVNMHGMGGRQYQRWTYFKISRSFTFVDYNGFGEYEFLDPYVSPYGTRWR